MGHILVVDDEPAIVTVVRERLEREGFAVRAVASGEEALAQADIDPPDLMVLDVMLPDINGKEVCHIVRSDKAMDDVRIICISGMVEEDKVGELRAAGADDFMHKPFEVGKLIERMCQLLDIEAVPST